MRYLPDELKAIALHYGSYNVAAKKLNIGKASLVDAANSDIKGKAYSLSEKNYNKIYRHLSRLGQSSKNNIRAYEKLLESISDHPNVKRGYMNAKQSDREWVKNLRQKVQYRKLKSNIFWNKVMTKFYDKYNWQKGRWSK